jgi:hypothetical protein
MISEEQFAKNIFSFEELMDRCPIIRRGFLGGKACKKACEGGSTFEETLTQVRATGSMIRVEIIADKYFKYSVRKDASEQVRTHVLKDE